MLLSRTSLLRASLQGPLQGLGRCVASRGAIKRVPCLRALTGGAPTARGGGAAAASALADAPFAAEAPSEVDAVPVEAPAYRANVDFKFVRDNLELVAQNCRDRAAAADPHRVAQLYEEFVRLQQETDAVRAARNDNSSAMKGKLEAERRQELIERGKALKEQLEQLDARLTAVEEELQREGQRLPNLSHPDAPVGGEDAAAVLRTVGAPRAFDFAPKDHVALGEELDLVDWDAGAAVSGSKFYYLKREAALLELALVNFAVQRVVAAGFTPLMTPDLVRESVFEKCGFQPRGANTQIYSVHGSGLCLTGTAEIPLGGIYMDQILSEAQLPIKMAAFGHCFRTEAGSAGSAGRGLYRVHQFSKVEMFVICTPAQSDALHQELVALEAALYEELGLHFKVLDMPTQDLGAPAHRKFDIEAWMPGLGRYGEISSASNCTDYQARRLNIRFRPGAGDDGSAAPQQQQQQQPKKKKGGGGGKKSPTQFVHTLNATACAVPRMIVAILENCQQVDGSVVIPPALRPYMMGIEAIRPQGSAGGSSSSSSSNGTSG